MAATKKQKLCGESQKSKRYDRQLRLWGDHGQVALENAHVCLINATATGTEILKSLVLPGIGAFTIVDGNKVSEEDVGNNFFVDSENLGNSRAKVATEFLVEMNSEVNGDFVDEHVEQMLAATTTYFQRFSLVIATGLSEKNLLLLSDKLWKDKVPFLVCRSYGMIGYMRLQFYEHCIIESHPDSDFYDLRLDKPFKSLQEFSDSIDLESLNNKDHSHTPFVVILLKYLDKWKQKNNGSIPKTIKEKNLLKSEVREGMRTLKDGGVEENFEEALKAINRAVIETEVPPDIKQLFEDPACSNLKPESSPFWIMVNALKEFCKSNGHLPLSGVIPDMTADSERYVELQKLYRSEAQKDTAAVYASIQKTLSVLGKPQDLISENDVKLFCKNSRYLRIVRGTCIAHEYSTETTRIQKLVLNLDHDDSDFIYYILLRAVDKFYLEFKRYPGLYNDQVEPDIVKLKSFMCKLVQEWNCGPLSRDDYVHELCRFGAAELHSVASFIGGCAAQEVIKLITGQFVPFSNTFIYNAMASTSSVFYL